MIVAGDEGILHLTAAGRTRLERPLLPLSALVPMSGFRAIWWLGDARGVRFGVSATPYGEAVDATGGPGTVPPRAVREMRARTVAEAFGAAVGELPDADEQARTWVAKVDPRSHVGSVHHTVPRFLLQRWARDDQVRVYSRLDRSFSTRNVRDLGIRDFYTFIDLNGSLDSSFETLLSEVETRAAEIVGRIMSPFTRTPEVGQDDLYWMASLVSFQVVRTTRRRRELELQGEWFAKTMASGRVPDAELREISVVPHQNDSLRASFLAAEHLVPVIACRPMALVVLDRPRFLVGDEPVIVNTGSDDGEHHPDCFLTDAQVQARIAKGQRKKKRLRRDVGRVVHFRPTATRGLGVALEIVLPVSPRAALWWGPLEDAPFAGPLEVDRLDGANSLRFADLVNAAIMDQALDWVISTPDDKTFEERKFPDPGPLMTVCDGDNAAALAMNEVPSRFRPHRLTRP